MLVRAASAPLVALALPGVVLGGSTITCERPATAITSVGVVTSGSSCTEPLICLLLGSWVLITTSRYGGGLLMTTEVMAGVFCPFIEFTNASVKSGTSTNPAGMLPSFILFA